MRRLGLWASALTLALLASGPWAPGRAASDPVAVSSSVARPGTFDADPGNPNCLEPWPDVAATAAIPSDTNANVNLDVRILLDKVNLDRGRAVVADLARSFDPVKIKIVATYETVTFTSTTVEDKIKQAKSRFGGLRPAGADIVHVLTKDDLKDLAGSSVPAGGADCIGGIKNPGQGFSVSESYGLENFRVGPLTTYYKAESKVAAHEIAHLLGGQHHLANCVEGVTSELEVPEVSPCTLMFNTVELASFNLSTANARIVRAYAFKYAK